MDGDWVHVSGTTGFDYATMTISDDVVEQARAVPAHHRRGPGGGGQLVRRRREGAVPAA
ncbi:hypothetical protein [Nonomuraea dietziae]|uniref:hypothetical protein n=1 Tax=Nonomuraea dietziae TaxID=65515 RepID=UPI0031E09532